jgi:predicted membrane channel-forming protein YqfA (hemolysin III family)
MMRKKGQLDVVVFVIMFVAILIAAPIMFKFFHMTIGPVQTAFANMSPQANTTLTYVTNTYDAFWDFAVLMMFIALVATLLISSFLVDIHPVFLVLYIILAFVIIIITPMLATPANVLDTQLNLTATYGSHLQYTDFLRTNIVMVVLAVIIISGIIAFGKMRMGRGQQI